MENINIVYLLLIGVGIFIIYKLVMMIKRMIGRIIAFLSIVLQLALGTNFKAIDTNNVTKSMFKHNIVLRTLSNIVRK